MLLLVTVLLVLAGLVLLIVGFVQDSLNLIYMSIGCAAVAGVALIVFGRLSRRRAVRLAHRLALEPQAPPRAARGAARERGEEVLVRAGDRGPRAGQASDAGEAEATEVPGVRPNHPAPGGSPAAAAVSVGAEPTGPDPVSDAVQLTEAARERTSGVAPKQEPVSVREPITRETPVVAGPTAAEEWSDDWGDEVVFPIEDYDDLRVGEIVPLLPELEPDELEEVRDRESAGKRRGMIVRRIDELLGRQPAGAASRSRPAPPRTAPSPPARRSAAAAKAAPAKRAGARATAPSKRAGKAAAASTPAKRQTAAPVPTKRVAAKTAAPAKRRAAQAGKAASAPAPAKRAATKAAPAPRAAAAKAAPARRTAAKAAPPPAKRATPKAAPAKRAATKAAPAKRAATRAAPAKRAAAPAKAPAKATAKKSRR